MIPHPNSYTIWILGSNFHFSHVDFYPFFKLLSILFIPLSSFFLYCLSRFLLFFSEALPLLFGHCFRSSLSLISLYIHNLLFSYLQNISLVLSLSLSLSLTIDQKSASHSKIFFRSFFSPPPLSLPISLSPLPIFRSRPLCTQYLYLSLP